MTLLQMSIASVFLIFAIVIIRALFMHRLPKLTFIVLCFIVLIRLLIPFSIPSQTSFFNLLNVQVPTHNAAPAMDSGINSVESMPQNDITPHIISDITQTIASATSTTTQSALLSMVLFIVYFTGFAVSAVFFAVFYIKSRKKFRASLPIVNDFLSNWTQNNKLMRPISIRFSENTTTPLTYGLLRPVILLPSGTNLDNEQELSFILAHELVHISRFDAITKVLITIALCVHWFNPFVWVMYFVFNRDIEISCDEAVIKMFGASSKKGYALTLINMAERRSNPPLYTSFSRYAIEERIHAIMKIKKKSIFGAIIALMLTTTTLIVLATTEAVEMQLINFEINNQAGVPLADVISPEEAAQIGANAIYRFFGFSLEDSVISLDFTGAIDIDHEQQPRIWQRLTEMDNEHVQTYHQLAEGLDMTMNRLYHNIFNDESPYTFAEMARKLGITNAELNSILVEILPLLRDNTLAQAFHQADMEMGANWVGTGSIVNESNFGSKMFNFSVCANTANVVSAALLPHEARAISDEITRNEQLRPLTPQDNEYFSRLSMDKVVEFGFMDTPYRASIQVWHSTISDVAQVNVQHVDGNEVVLTYQGFFSGDVVFTGIFKVNPIPSPFTRTVAGNAFFEWVYR